MFHRERSSASDISPRALIFDLQGSAPTAQDGDQVRTQLHGQIAAGQFVGRSLTCLLCLATGAASGLYVSFFIRLFFYTKWSLPVCPRSTSAQHAPAIIFAVARVAHNTQAGMVQALLDSAIRPMWGGSVECYNSQAEPGSTPYRGVC